MVSREIVLQSEKGLHLRPAGKVCDLALNFKAHVQMKIGDRSYNLKSMLSVLSAQAAPGTRMEILCEGPDEDQALEEICRLLTGDLEKA